MATENNETTVPLYNRGSERINLDAVANAVNIDVFDRLERSGLKDNLKKLVRSEVSKLILGMYDGTVTYRMTGGFDNTIGMTNKENEFDASAIAAGIVGNAVRRASVYLEPKAKTDSSKQTWDSTKAILEALLNNIYGTSKGDIPDSMFIDLDPYENGARSHEKRVGKLREALNDILENFESTFNKYNYSSDDETRSRTAIKKVVDEILNDDKVTDNELLDLYKLTGIDFRNSFYTGEGYPTKTSTQLSTEEITPTALPITSLLEEAIPSILDWRAQNYPSKPFNTQYVQLGGGKGSREQINWLKSLISLLDSDKLFSILIEGLNNPKVELSRNFKTERGTYILFSNERVAETILLRLQNLGALESFKQEDGTYYINNSYNSSTGTGMIWDPKTRRLIKKSAYDIPHFTSYIANEYYKKYPLARSYKEGGVIKKFLDGGWFEKLYKYLTLKNWNKNLPNTKWKQGTSFHGNASNLETVAKANAAYTADLKAIGEDINSFINNSGIFGLDLTPEQVVTLYNLKALEIRNFWNLEVDYENTDAAPHNTLFLLMFNNRSKTADGNDTYNLSWLDDGKEIAGSLTWHRRMDRYEKEFDQLTPEERQSRIHTVTRIINERPLTFQVYKKANGDIEIYNSKTQLQSLPGIEEMSEEVKTPSGTPEVPGTKMGTSDDLLHVGEGGLPEGKDPSVKTPWWLGITPNLIGAGRLWASLATNRNVYNTLMSSLRPVLKDTYERYSPVTGAFSAMQLKNRQGADIMREASQPFTSDASLAAARMLEGQRQANLLLAEGFLMDDQEIKRTLAEALARQEDNMARRSEVANFNRASINQTNREKALLKASHFKSNWSSIDNFLAEILDNTRRRFDDIKEKTDSFMDNLDYSAADEWYNDVMKQPLAELADWTRDGTKTMESWNKYLNYQDYKVLAQKYKEAMLKERIARRYGLPYKNPYSQGNYKTFSSIWR